MFYLTFLFFTMFILLGIMYFLPIYIKDPDNSQDFFISKILMPFIFYLLYTGYSAMICLLALKYSQPLMTRRNIETQENVTLLCFVRSKYDMRKIFDGEQHDSLD